jgi:hypothetical protein
LARLFRHGAVKSRVVSRAGLDFDARCDVAGSEQICNPLGSPRFGAVYWDPGTLSSRERGGRRVKTVRPQAAVQDCVHDVQSWLRALVDVAGMQLFGGRGEWRGRGRDGARSQRIRGCASEIAFNYAARELCARVSPAWIVHAK